MREIRHPLSLQDKLLCLSESNFPLSRSLNRTSDITNAKMRVLVVRPG